MKCVRVFPSFLAAWLIAIGLGSSSQGGFTPGVEIDPIATNTGNNGVGYTMGYSFTAKTTFTINSLGYFDDKGAAFLTNHAVGLWNSSGTLLASTTITNADTLEENFRYNAIANLTVVAGQTYTVAGVSGTSDPYTYSPTTYKFDSAITVDSDEYIASTALKFPTSSTGSDGFFGGTFGVTTPNVIPAPSSITLVGLGALGMVGLRVVRRRPRISTAT